MWQMSRKSSLQYITSGHKTTTILVFFRKDWDAALLGKRFHRPQLTTFSTTTTTTIVVFLPKILYILGLFFTVFLFYRLFNFVQFFCKFFSKITGIDYT